MTQQEQELAPGAARAGQTANTLRAADAERAVADSREQTDASGGPLHRLRKALGRLRRRFALETFDVFGRGVRAEDATFEAPAGYEFRLGTPADVLACDARHTELDATERQLGARRLELGHAVVLGSRDGEVVFSMWVNPRHLNVPGHVKRRLGPGQRFIYKAYTSPDHRGRKLYQAGMRFVLADMARAGLDQLVGYAHVKKGISRRGLAALGFDDLGRFRTLDFPGLRRTMVGGRLRRHFPTASPRSGALATPPPTAPSPH